MNVNRPILIGIAGGTASGKTSIANALLESFKASNSVIIIKEDDYYKDQSNLSFEERTKTNYDHPLAFDFDLMEKQLHQLLNNESIEKPTYDYTIHNRSEVVEKVDPADVIILEGLFALYNPNIRDIEDIKIYVDTASDVRFIRRLKRDMVERQRSLDSIIEQYLNTVKPMHDQFIEPSKQYAHVIIPNGKSNKVGIDLIKTKIDSILNDKML